MLFHGQFYEKMKKVIAVFLPKREIFENFLKIKIGPFSAYFFFILVFSMQLFIQLIVLPMTGFELQFSGARSDSSTKCTTTTALRFTKTNWVHLFSSEVDLGAIMYQHDLRLIHTAAVTRASAEIACI